MNLTDLDFKTEYRSKLDDVVRDFYNPALKQAVSYQRAVGFFSSSSLVALTSGICGLIENGGSIQIIASPRLSTEDIEAINDGLRRRDEVIKEALIRELQEPKGKFEEARLNLLSNLIAAGRLQIKIAFLEDENGVGLFHEKLGLISDKENNTVAFSGSMNESANAFMSNYEAIDVFTSWSQDASRVSTKRAAFEAMWRNCEQGIKVMEFPEINEEILHRYKLNDQIDTALDEEFLKEINNENKPTVTVGPRIPKEVKLRPYQIEAIENWANHEYVGIFDMATGTGKTYTALGAIAKLYEEKNQRLAVIIVCPFQHLVEQWVKDIKAFGMKPIICYSASSQRNWKKRLKRAVQSFNLNIQDHFCMVTTNATFSSNYVQDLIKKLNGNVVIVVDEAHNFGAQNLRKTLLPNIPYRLALSATLDRHGDPEGTQILYDYFNEKCIEYSLKEAIENSMLTPYYYYPILVSLNEEELDEYLDLTSKIKKSIFRNKDGKIELSDYTKMQLIKRARIVAGAQNKIGTLKEILKEYQNDNKILIYCGATTIHDISYKENEPPKDEARQIDIIVDLVGNDLNMRISKFTSEEKAKEREQIKEDFAEGTHLQALAAIRCLDEGIDIPSIKTAFILASSTNPKEYIQRRGRVLRKFPGKQFATIYDFVTLPIPFEDVDKYNLDVIESVKSLAKREIVRIKDFAEIAENPFDSDSLISKIQEVYGIEYDFEEEEEFV